MELIRQTKCSLCNSTNFKILVKVKEYEYTQCKNCGLIFSNPMPLMTLEELDFLNESVWYPTCKLINKFNWADFNRYKEYKHQFRVFQKYKSKGKLLDIGCGTGYYLLSAKFAGFDVYGSEVSTAALKYVRDYLHIPAFNGRLEDIGLPPEYFDAVRLSNVLEHLPSPVETLKEVNRILKKDGILELGLPNPESFLNFLHNVYHCITGLFRKNKFCCELSPPVHLYAFPKKTLRLLLEKTEFKPLQMIVSGSGNKTYKPFILYKSPRVGDEIVDMIGKGLGKGSILYVYAQKRNLRKIQTSDIPLSY